MIAKNYIKYPEALRFQCEMFSNGYHNSPRIMRLMEVIFDWSATVPDWVKEAKTRARNLVKAWKSQMVEMFEMLKTKAKKVTPRQLELVLFPEAETKEYWNDAATTTPQKQPEIFPPENYFASQRWTPSLTTEKPDWSWNTDTTAEWLTGMSSVYVSYCRRHQGGHQGHAGSKQQVKGYQFNQEQP